MFKDFVRKVGENKCRVFGIEVFFRGEVVNHYAFEPDIRHPIYSATKAFTATAVGIAVKEDKFSIDASIYDYLKEEVPEKITAGQLSDLHKVSIRRLLTMSVPGYPFRIEDENWMNAALTYPIRFSEVPVFDYSNIPAYLVGAAVEKAVGQHLALYLKDRLFEPLGIINPDYMNCPSGHFYGASGMYLTVNELSRLGQLYMQNGYYNSKQIISEQWVKEATATQLMNKEGGYGFYLWKYKDGFRISGKWGQRCYVFPRQQLMITYLSDDREKADIVTKLMEQELLPQYGI